MKVQKRWLLQCDCKTSYSRNEDRRFFAIINIDKPFKSIEEQIQILKDRNLFFHDEDFAKQILTSVPYYSIINGYKGLFFNKYMLENEIDHFDSEASFELIYYTYLLDIDFNSILLKYILMIEKSFKAKLAYRIAEKYGENNNNYLKKENYSNRKNKRSSILDSLNNLILEPRIYTPSFYYINQKGYIPPWILTNDMMFGLAQQWYSILNEDLKNMICEDMFSQKFSDFPLEDKKDFLMNSLYLLRDFRNAAAHGARTFNFKHPKNKLNRNIYRFTENKIVNKQEYVKLNRGQNDIFSILVIITMFLNEPISSDKFLRELESYNNLLREQNILNKSAHQVFNLPNDFVDRLKKIK